jgi:hypothetical protein
MLRDNLVGLIEPMFSSAGANPLALCIARQKSSDDRPPSLENPLPRRGGIYTNGQRRLHFRLDQHRSSRNSLSLDDENKLCLPTQTMREELIK